MNFVSKEQINKGWSSDKKYCVTDENGTQYLLRISDITQYETKAVSDDRYQRQQSIRQLREEWEEALGLEREERSMSKGYIR